MKIVNQTQSSILADSARIADTFFLRLVGLLNQAQISPGEALVITPCHQIHMFFMKFAIDVIFVNQTDHVVGLVENIQPFSLSPIFKEAHRSIELPVGTIAQSRTSIGDTIRILTS